MASNISLASPQRPDTPSAFWPVPHPLVASRVAPKARPRATHLLSSSSERVAGAEPTPTGWRSETELLWLPTGVAPLGPVPLIDPAPQGSSWAHRSTHALEDGTDGPVLMVPIDIRVLGSLRLLGIRGQCRGSIMGRHQLRNLLSMLVASAGPLPAERVMDLLWPKSDVPRARNRLHHCLNMLRGGLSELAWDDNWIRVEKGMLLLDARIRTDAGLLEDAVAQGLNLYSDDELLELADLCTGHCTAEVGDDESMRCAKDRLDLLQTLVLRAAVTRLDAGKHMMLMRELLQRLLRLQPLDEWALERLVDLELRAQQRQRALRTLQEAEDLMKHRLNVPAPKKLQEQRRRINALTASDRLHGATPPERLMLGRDDLIAPMLDQIDVGPTLWNIHGAPGVGKQALVNCLTERLDHRFQILRLDLSGPSLADRHALPQITQALTADDCPLVLMVCAQDLPLEEANAWLQANAAHLQALRAIVLSTCPVQVDGIQHLALAPLDVPPCWANASRVRLSNSVNLLLALCPSLDLGEGGDPAWSWLGDIVRELDGFPQALDVAARRLCHLTLAELRDELHQEDHTPEWLQPSVDALALHLQRDVLPSLPEVAVRWLLSTASLPRVAQAAAFDNGAPPELERLLALNLLRQDPQRQTWELAALHRRALRALAQQQRLEQPARRQWAESLAQLTPPAPSLESPRYLSWLGNTLPLQDELEEALRIVWPQDMQASQQLLWPLCALWSCGVHPDRALAWTSRLLQTGEVQMLEPALSRQLDLTHAALLISRHHFAAALPLTQRLLTQSQAAADDAHLPEQRAHALALHAQTQAALGGSAAARSALQERLMHVPECQPGHWLLTTALLGLDDPARPAAGGPFGRCATLAQTEHLQGSWVWIGLLAAMAPPAGENQASTRLRATVHAVQLQHTGYRLGLRWLSDLGILQQHRLAHAVGHHEQARLCLIDWYHASLSEGRRLAAMAAALLLGTRDTRASTAQGRPGHWLQHAQALAQSCKHTPKAWRALVLTRLTLQQLEQGNVDQACQTYARAVDLVASQPEPFLLGAMLESAHTLLRALSAPQALHASAPAAINTEWTPARAGEQEAGWTAVAACHMQLLLRPSTASAQATALHLSTRARRPANSEQRRQEEHGYTPT